MIRPFGLRDILAVRSLQRSGVWMDIHHYLIQRRSALITALVAPVPWLATGLASYVWQPRGQGVSGFVQMLQRPGRVEADVLFLAPGSQSGVTWETPWQEMLSFCIREAAAHGLRRLFASLPLDSTGVEVLATLTFSNYATEDVYVLRTLRTPLPAYSGALEVRPQHPEDAWWVRRIYSLYTPRAVQYAEGMNDANEPSGLPLAWWELSQQKSYVLVHENEVRGAVQLASGRRGHWLSLCAEPADSQAVEALLQQGLYMAAESGRAGATLRWTGRRPVYCAVRDYQAALGTALQDHGFEPLTRRVRFVKHLAVPAKEPERAPVPSLVMERTP